MKYKHFHFAIILRLSIIIILAGLASYLFFAKQAYIFAGLTVILLGFALGNIIWYFNNINRWISFFLLGIENEDTTLKIPSKTGSKSIDDIFEGMNRLNQIYKQTKIDITTQEQHFRSMINQSATGLFSINENDRIINLNPAAQKMCNIQEFFHVNALQKIDPTLPDFIKHQNKNKPESAIFENKYGQKLLFKISEINTPKERITLVAVSDITKELDNREVEAWIKLARTLSHEIMNNITPITTLSKVILDYFMTDNQINKLNQDVIDNTVKGLQVIEERSSGLMQFVQNYRKFTKLPEPQIQRTDLSEILEKMIMAASSFEGFEDIQIKKSIPPEFPFDTDANLLSQVILNLLKNATEALIESPTQNPIIRIKLQHINNTAHISITNNGNPIPPALKEQIFVPFFTTKKQGSGIGLSLSKQILHQMNGDIQLQTGKNKDTSFVVLLQEM
jgi:nitrogen fixation/metabolism regulation signal transduction histidine kinase